MKKITFTVLLVSVGLLMAVPILGYARGDGHFAGGHIGGWGGYRGGGRIVVRGGLGWDWWPWAIGGAMIGATLPYYYPPPVIVQEQLPVYVQPEQQAYYWYYCQNPQGYYPYVKSCPSGWMKVVPDATPPNTEEGMAK